MVAVHTTSPSALRLVNGLAVVSAVLLLGAFWLLGRARPQQPTFLDRHLDASVRSGWDRGPLELSQDLMAVAALTGLAVVILSLVLRCGPRSGQFWSGLILLGTSLAGIFFR